MMINSVGSASVEVQNQLKNNRIESSILWYIAVVILIFFHAWTVYHFAVNMPFLDDYTFVIDILSLKAKGFAVDQVISTILAPHGPHTEHMIVFGRTAAIFDYLIEGELNFRTLFFVGNATLILTVALLYYATHKAGLASWKILPVGLLVLQPQYYENTTTWAICALQHLPALFFAFTTFYLIINPKFSRALLGYLTALIALFSNGNGVAVLIAGFLVLLISGQYRRLTYWTIFSVASYFVFYHLTHSQPSTPTDSNIAHPLRIVGGFFLINGSMGLLFTQSLIGLGLVGILVALFLALLVIGSIIQLPTFFLRSKHIFIQMRRKIRKWISPADEKISLFLIGCYGYLLLTVLGIAFARSDGWYYGLLVPRFIWFTTMLVVVGYLLVMIHLKPANQLYIGRSVLILSLWFNIWSYWVNIDEIENVHKSLSSDLHNWRENQLLITMPSGLRKFDKFYSQILRDAIKEGIYTLPEPDFESALVSSSGLVDKPLTLIEKDSTYRQGERTCARLTLAKHSGLHAKEAYLLLRSRQHTFVWPIDQSSHKLIYFLENGGPIPSGEAATVFMDMLPETSYEVGILHNVNSHWQASYSRQVINVRPL